MEAGKATESYKVVALQAMLKVFDARDHFTIAMEEQIIRRRVGELSGLPELSHSALRHRAYAGHVFF